MDMAYAESVPEEFLTEIRQQLSDSANVIKDLQSDLINLHKIYQQISAENKLLKNDIKKLKRQTHSRINPDVLSAFFKNFKSILKFQRSQVKSLSRASRLKERFIYKQLDLNNTFKHNATTE